MYNIHAIFSQIYYFCVTSKYILYFDKNAPLIQLQLFSLLILEYCFTYAALFSYLFAYLYSHYLLLLQLCDSTKVQYVFV